jgi:hypothetical protein
MAANKQDISDWFDAGVRQKSTHLIVVCDTFDYEDYPVYVAPSEDVRLKVIEHTGNMQKVMEVYNLSMPKQAQLDERRAFNY